MTTKMPKDANKEPIPALRLKKDGAHKISFTATSARTATAFDQNTRVISLYATQDCHVRLGDQNVFASATDHFFPAGVYYDIAIGGDGVPHTPYIAAIRVSADGILYISEKS